VALVIGLVAGETIDGLDILAMVLTLLGVAVIQTAGRSNVGEIPLHRLSTPGLAR
jgi:hypothetical protein